MSTQYDRGRVLEYRVKTLLEGHNYLVVRSAGSKGPVDLVALPRVRLPPFCALSATLLVQCKRGGVLTRTEWNDLVGEALSVSAVAVLASWSPGQPLELWRLTGMRPYPPVRNQELPRELLSFEPHDHIDDHPDAVSP